MSLVTEQCGVDLEALRHPGMDRESSYARAMMALLAREFEGVTMQELADCFHREASGMSKAAGRLANGVRPDTMTLCLCCNWNSFNLL